MIDRNITKTFEYVDGISIDTDMLCKSVEEIQSLGLQSTWKQKERQTFNLDKAYVYNSQTSVYDQFEVQKDVIDAITPQLDFDCHPDFIRYQVIRRGIPKHTDAKRYGVINYLIKAGGDFVYTHWYDDNDNIIETQIVEENSWYKMRTDIDHRIIGMTSDRLMLSISLMDWNW